VANLGDRLHGWQLNGDPSHLERNANRVAASNPHLLLGRGEPNAPRPERHVPGGDSFDLEAAERVDELLVLAVEGHGGVGQWPAAADRDAANQDRGRILLRPYRGGEKDRQRGEAAALHDVYYVGRWPNVKGRACRHSPDFG